jgi:hypothetical protein
LSDLGLFGALILERLIYRGALLLRDTLRFEIRIFLAKIIPEENWPLSFPYHIMNRRFVRMT